MGLATIGLIAGISGSVATIGASLFTKVATTITAKAGLIAIATNLANLPL